MDGVLVEISICIGGLPVYVVVQGAVWIFGDPNIKEQDLAVFFHFQKYDTMFSLNAKPCYCTSICTVF